MRKAFSSLPLGLVVALALAPATAAEELHGEPRVIDGVTLEVDGQRLRLYGITAPKPGDDCMLRGNMHDCGVIAASHVMDMTLGTPVTCTLMPGGSGTARCSADGYDLSFGMVYSGWARALPDAPAQLHDGEARARRQGHGLWQGAFPAHVDATAGGPADG